MTHSPDEVSNFLTRLRDTSNDPYFHMTPGVKDWLQQNWILREKAATLIEQLGKDLELLGPVTTPVHDKVSEGQIKMPVETYKERLKAAFARGYAACREDAARAIKAKFPPSVENEAADGTYFDGQMYPSSEIMTTVAALQPAPQTEKPA